MDRMEKVARQSLALLVEREELRRRRLDSEVLECLYSNGTRNMKRGDKGLGERLRDALDAPRVKPKFRGDWAMPTRKSPLTRMGALATGSMGRHQVEREPKTVVVVKNGKKKRVPIKHASQSATVRDGSYYGMESIHENAN